MKKAIFPIVFIMMTSLVMPTAYSYEPPSENKLSQLLANPKLIKEMLGDADGAEAATLMLRIISRLEGTDLGPKQVEYLIAYYTARISYLLPPSELSTFATSLLAGAPAGFLPTIYSGLSIGGAGNAAFMTELREMAGDDAVLQTAISTPNVQLTDPVYRILTAALGTYQTLPPAPTDSLPPPPPEDAGPDQPRTPPPPAPPVPPTYDGQG